MKLIKWIAFLMLSCLLTSCGVRSFPELPVTSSNLSSPLFPNSCVNSPSFPSSFGELSDDAVPTPTPIPTPTPTPTPTPECLEILRNMTLEEKIASLFIVRPEVLGFGNAEQSKKQVTKELEAGLRRYPVAGVILSSYNIESKEQLLSYIDHLQNSTKYPLFITVDEEGGRVARIANSGKFPVKKYSSMLDVGMRKDPLEALDVGKTIGHYLKELHFNMDFAPVADVFTNKENKVIGDRSFGSDPHIVSEMVTNAMKGFQSEHIIPVIKHFPGHGDTKGDTHTGFVKVDKTWEELLQCEILPFQKAIHSGADAVMTAHITAKNVTGTSVPASLSYELITGKLRNELHFQGVVISDALEMGAITQNYTEEEAVLRCILAGSDLLLAPKNFEKSYQALLQAVKDGQLTEERINESVLRILTLKEKYKIL